MKKGAPKAGKAVKAGQIVGANVVSTAPHWIHLMRGTLEILVHVSDVEWGEKISPREYAQVGDPPPGGQGGAAAGWLPWPSKQRSRGPSSST